MDIALPRRSASKPAAALQRRGEADSTERLKCRASWWGARTTWLDHVIAHAERLCDSVAIIAGGKVPYAGSVDAARDRIPAQVRLETRRFDGSWRRALPADARHEGAFWYFPLPESGIEPLLRALIEGDAGILSLSIERAGLHDAFVAIAGEAAAKALEVEPEMVA